MPMLTEVIEQRTPAIESQLTRTCSTSLVNIVYKRRL